jgi:hypothetical protein
MSVLLTYPRQALANLRNSDLFRRDTPTNTASEVVGWWEARRVSYNLIVGICGILTCIVTIVVSLASEIFFGIDFGWPDPPLFALVGVVLYGIAALFASPVAG